MINPHWLELLISRTNFHSPKDIWAIEVRLHFCIMFCLGFSWSFVLPLGIRAKICGVCSVIVCPSSRLLLVPRKGSCFVIYLGILTFFIYFFFIYFFFSFILFYFVYLVFTALSRIFHLYRADRSSNVGENRRTPGKTTWPSASRTWLSQVRPERGSNYNGEKPNGLRVRSLIH